MEFREYMHVERLDNVAVDGILNGTCYIYPKIDGTNASFWSDGLEVFAGSRTRKLGKGANDNAGFYEWLIQPEQKELRNMALYNPRYIFYGEWLCLSGDTKIRLVSGGKRGHTMTLEDMYKYQESSVIEKSKYVKNDGTMSESIRPSWWKRHGYPQCFSLFLDEDVIKPQRIAKIIKTGKKDVYEVKTRNGYCIKSTLEHKFYTNNGWKSLKDLSVNDVVATSELYNHKIKRRYGKGSNRLKRVFKELRNSNCCDNCGSISSLEVHHIDENWGNNNIGNLKILCRECHSKFHSNITAINQKFNYNFDKIISIQHVGTEECYDISMGACENSSSFVANGFIVHNCPHTLRTYAPHAWKKFYLFDVYDRGTKSYIHPSSIVGLLKSYGISVMDTWIPPLDVKVNPTRDELYKLLQSNTYLIPDDKGIGEGIVIKNYSFVNKFGRTIWAKIVNSEFKHKQTKEARPDSIGGLIEEKIVDKYITEAVIDKDIIKVQQQRGVDYWDNKFIPQLFEQVYNTLITEEMYDIVARKFKNCVIDFKLLKNITINKIKQIKKDMF